MQETDYLARTLLHSQHVDGGWSYASVPCCSDCFGVADRHVRPVGSDPSGTEGAGSHSFSRVEPTALCLLALEAAKDSSTAAARSQAVRWLLHQQKASGGWTPAPNVEECTSVTSLALLGLLSLPNGEPTTLTPEIRRQVQAAVDWTVGHIYSDKLSFSLLLAQLFHIPPPHAPGSVAWYPGTAGWVIPTSLAILALSKTATVLRRPELRKWALDGCHYLLSRRCSDQGWNHGGSSARSEDAVSYPETTGLALLALRAASVTPPTGAVALAKQFASTAESIEGLAWLQLAFSSGPAPIQDMQPLPKCHTATDYALRLLALTAQNGTNAFLESVS